MSDLLIEVDLHKLPKATAVVVPDGLGITKSLQQGVGCRNQTVLLALAAAFLTVKTGSGHYLPLSSHRCPAPSRMTSSGTWKGEPEHM